MPIETAYLDGNRSSHFSPLRDSMRIYFVLVRFCFSSLLAAGLDFLGFTLSFELTHNLLLSFAVGRLSSLLNFAINCGWVFRNRGSVAAALCLLRRYFSCCREKCLPRHFFDGSAKDSPYARRFLRCSSWWSSRPLPPGT